MIVFDREIQVTRIAMNELQESANELGLFQTRNDELHQNFERLRQSHDELERFFFKTF